jgi:hypothetical protein
MASKKAANRTTERRKREKQMGMERLDISLHQTTMDMLTELVEAAGYKLNSREKSRGITGVLTQIIFEVHRRLDKVNLNRQEQQGFILAQKVRTLKDQAIGPKKVTKYVQTDKPSDYLDTVDAEWSRETLIELIQQYSNVFGEPATDEQLSSVANKPADKSKKQAIKKKTQSKRG